MCLGYIWSALTCQRFGLRAALLAASLMQSQNKAATSCRTPKASPRR